MTGLTSVKKVVHSLVATSLRNYRHEVAGERIDEVALNRLFVGNPGTGKTTIAKLYGRILSALKLLSNGEVVYKTASDFVGDVVGESQQKTRAIIEMSQGKVLLIDEAYVLDDGLYGKQALDTIVELVFNKPGEDIAVIMAGYEAPLLKMIREQNPGLARRFNASQVFRFHSIPHQASALGLRLSTSARLLWVGYMRVDSPSSSMTTTTRSFFASYHSSVLGRSSMSRSASNGTQFASSDSCVRCQTLGTPARFKRC